jgi:PDZ domain-containing protein
VFLVPDENCTEAVATAPQGLQLVRVTGLGDAVTQLEALDSGTPPRSC